MVNFISKKFLGALAALILIMTPALADTEVEVGVDAVSRYVWRGTPLGNSVALQPSVNFAIDSGVGVLAEAGSTNVGIWGSYDLASGDSDEINIVPVIKQATNTTKVHSTHLSGSCAIKSITAAIADGPASIGTARGTIRGSVFSL